MKKNIFPKILSAVLGLITAQGLILLTTSSSKAADSISKYGVVNSCRPNVGYICGTNGHYYADMEEIVSSTSDEPPTSN
jgi:hypothetical protein